VDLYTIIIPTYNRQDLLKECIASVQAQTYSNWECIIVDDGSTDGTKLWLEAIQDVRISLIRTEHKDRSAARNKGFEVSKGDFIQFVDDDDIITETYLEDYAKERSRSGIKNQVIRCGMEMFWADGQRRQTTNYNPTEYVHPVRYLVKHMCGVGCVSIPRQALQDNQFDQRWPHWQDTHLFMRIAIEVPFVQVENYNYLYRQHDEMGTRKIFNSDQYRDERLRLTLGAMDDLWDRYKNSIKDYISEREWREVKAKKYMNFALETANQGLMVSFDYLKESWSYAFIYSMIPYYLRIPYFILRSKF